MPKRWLALGIRAGSLVTATSATASVQPARISASQTRSGTPERLLIMWAAGRLWQLCSAGIETPAIPRYVRNMISAKRIKAARLFLDWEQRDLSARSGLSVPTLRRMEKLGMARSSVASARKVQHALELAGVEFIPENGGGAGVRLRNPACTAD